MCTLFRIPLVEVVMMMMPMYTYHVYIPRSLKYTPSSLCGVEVMVLVVLVVVVLLAAVVVVVVVFHAVCHVHPRRLHIQHRWPPSLIPSSHPTVADAGGSSAARR